MAFTIQDYHDLARLLWEHPEWRDELRRLLLTDELLALPEIVQQLAEAQKRTEERLLRLETTVQHLTEQVNALTQGQKRLTEGQQRLTEQVSALTEGQQRLTDTVGGLKGRMLEITYHDKAFAYFGPLLRRVKVIELHTLEDALEAALTPDEFSDLLLLDLLVTGKMKSVSESPEIMLAVEISSVLDKMDVSRAVHRASLLRKAGYRAVPAVAGEKVTKGGKIAAQKQNVVLVQDGQVEFWKEAVDSWEGLQLAFK